MSPGRWSKLEELYHAARERDPAERSAFLADACQGDDDLKRQIENLLAQDSNGKILDGPASQVLPESKPVNTLSPGDQLGPYEILAPVGAGGMGEVWKARDRRLNRMVAIKVSKEQFSERFEREARAIAALNHPNICTLYDVGPNYLVMEFLEGAPLKGPLPLAKAVEYAGQILDALDAAHRTGLVHRDLKPANILITKQGAKLLDFGLAKRTSILKPDDPTATLTQALTNQGQIVGTLQYMSPEQLQGREADARSDIFSFGLVLYEMITGKRAFQGANPASLIGAILEREAPALEPEGLNRVVQTCLAKDPAERFQTARDLKRAIEWSVSPDAPNRTRRPWLAWSITAVATLCLATVALLHLRENPPTENAMPELDFSILPANGTSLFPLGSLDVDRVSPDSSTVLYRATDARFHIRRLSSPQDQMMPPLVWFGDPFWAPDSRSIAFQTTSGLMKVHLPNGAPEVVTRTIVGQRGGSWGDKGTVLVADGERGLNGVPAAGGKPFPVEIPGFKEGRYYNPEFLPGGDDFLFLFVPSDSATAQVYIATLRGAKAVDSKMLFSNETAAAFTIAGGGRILFVRDDNLYAQRLDVKARRLIGDTELVQPRVASTADTRNAYFSVSASGAIVWRSGIAVTSQVTVFDRKGNRTGTAGAPVPATVISLAPDEAHILVASEAGSWIMESGGPGRISLGSNLLRFWSRDGSGVIGVRGAEIYQQSLTGSHETRPLCNPPCLGGLRAFSADGQRILYSDGTSLLSLALDGDGRPEQVVKERVDNAALSPDGAWTVYHPGSEPGICVQPLTSPGLRRQIASSGNRAVWRADGKEILYCDRGQIWSVRVDGTGNQLHFAPPEPLFSAPEPLGLLSGARPLAVSRDGSKIYYLQSPEQPDSGVIHVHTRAIR